MSPQRSPQTNPRTGRDTRPPRTLVVNCLRHHDGTPAPEMTMATFEPVAVAVEQVAGPVEVIRPGVCALPVRGPVRRLGGEEPLVTAVRAAVTTRLPMGCGIGIADGRFAARLAAVRDQIVPAGATAAFLAPLTVTVLDPPELPLVLTRLGIRTLGDLAALPARDVVARFGADGRLAHRLARAGDERPAVTRAPTPDLTVTAELDPPAEAVDAAAFVARSLAEELRQRLARQGLVCLRVTIGAETVHGEEHLRRWRIDRLDVIADRVRWQLDGWLSGTAAERPSAGISRLWLAPDELAPAHGVQLRLWGEASEDDERARRTIARVQGLLGQDAVQIGVMTEARRLVDRLRLLPFDERVDEPPLPARRAPPRASRAPREVPAWPGQLPPPSPAVVHVTAPTAALLDARGAPVRVSGRAEISAAPAQLTIGGKRPVPVTAWAGPWPVDERWWDPDAHCRLARLQVVLADGSAHLLTLAAGRWQVAATYD